MTKIVINTCYGEFKLSNIAEKEYYRISGIEFDKDKVKRDDKLLVYVVESMGAQSFTSCTYLRVVEIPDDVEWKIESYDGKEWVAEVHRTWGDDDN